MEKTPGYIQVRLDLIDDIRDNITLDDSVTQHRLERLVGAFGQVLPIITVLENGRYKVLANSRIFRVCRTLSMDKVWCCVVDAETVQRRSLLSVALNTLEFEKDWVKIATETVAATEGLSEADRKVFVPFDDDTYHKLKTIAEYDFGALRQADNPDQLDLFATDRADE